MSTPHSLIRAIVDSTLPVNVCTLRVPTVYMRAFMPGWMPPFPDFPVPETQQTPTEGPQHKPCAPSQATHDA
eukprot:3434212-Amphidinium_carterae.2